MYYIPFVALFLAVVHILISKTHSPKRMIELILLYLLVIGVGVSGLIGFMGHTLKADEIARYIGWQPGSPFQFEVAIANLSYAVLGLLCVWFRKDFWTATVIGTSVFGFGAAFGHIREVIVYHNYAPGNAGFSLYSDIFMPIVLISLLIVLKTLSREE